MRTTIGIDDRLLAAAKPYRLASNTHRGRTLPGLHVTDGDRLFGRMEGRS